MKRILRVLVFLAAAVSLGAQRRADAIRVEVLPLNPAVTHYVLPLGTPTTTRVCVQLPLPAGVKPELACLTADQLTQIVTGTGPLGKVIK